MKSQSSGMYGQPPVAALAPAAQNDSGADTRKRANTQNRAGTGTCPYGGKYDPAIHHRRSIRLQGYDYSQAGAYFVTVCTQNRECLFGDIVNGEMRLNDAGKMIQAVWDEIPAYYPRIDIDSFIVMPNHIHGIVVIVGAAPRGRPGLAHSQGGQARGNGQPQGDRQAQGPAPTGLSLQDVVHRFKTMTTKRYADCVNQNGWSTFPGKLWQRNYWEHIVHNEPELNRIREYIHNNPAQWKLDTMYGRFINRPNAPCPTEIREPIAEYDMEAWMV